MRWQSMPRIRRPGRAEIFAVNEDALEVWWYNLSRTEDPEGPEVSGVAVWARKNG